MQLSPLWTDHGLQNHQKRSDSNSDKSSSDHGQDLSSLESTPWTPIAQDTLPIPDTVLTPKHTHDSCSCQSVSVKRDQIDVAANDQKLVLCRFRTAPIISRRAIEIFTVPRDTQIPYIAISHVRAAGLGNDLANSLPFCQLSLIQSFVNELGDADQGGTLFWIDTICLPVDRRLRKAALSLAWDIFLGARHVLVLDPTLYQHNLGSPPEALARIRHSPWKQRLWTLEEGFLASSLHFQFANGTTTLDDLTDELESIFPMRLRKATDRLCWPPTPIAPQEEPLRRLMKYFVEDVKRCSAELDQDIPVPPLGCTKADLFAMTRLGFLASPKFRYLIEDSERSRIRQLLKALTTVYGEFSDETLCSTSENLERGTLDRLRDVRNIFLGR